MTTLRPDDLMHRVTPSRGLSPYLVVLDLQRRLAAARANGTIADTLILTQHPPTITVGRSGNRSHILVSQAELHERGIIVAEVERGGDVVLHCPGQLVGYPVLDLRGRGSDLHRYIHDLEEVLLRVLAEYGISARRVPGKTGAWAAECKVGFVGVAVKRWVSLHGFCLNIEPDLKLFEIINPCGMAGVRVTSVAQLTGKSRAMADAARGVARIFQDVFGPVEVRDMIAEHGAPVSAVQSPL